MGCVNSSDVVETTAKESPSNNRKRDVINYHAPQGRDAVKSYGTPVLPYVKDKVDDAELQAMLGKTVAEPNDNDTEREATRVGSRKRRATVVDPPLACIDEPLQKPDMSILELSESTWSSNLTEGGDHADKLSINTDDDANTEEFQLTDFCEELPDIYYLNLPTLTSSISSPASPRSTRSRNSPKYKKILHDVDDDDCENEMSSWFDKLMAESLRAPPSNQPINLWLEGEVQPMTKCNALPEVMPLTSNNLLLHEELVQKQDIPSRLQKQQSVRSIRSYMSSTSVGSKKLTSTSFTWASKRY